MPFYLSYQYLMSHHAIAIVLILVVAVVALRLLNFVLLRATKWVSGRSEKSDGTDSNMRVRKAETYLSVGGALCRSLIGAAVVFALWHVIMPPYPGTTPVALVGASAMFIVLAGATIGPLLRDITSGTVMITEQWYNVGDHVVVDPFWNLSGVVEQLTLRSTKLRSLNGETVWIHNQHIQAVRVTPRGVRTIAVDTFVNDPVRGRQIVEQALTTIPVGPTMVATPITIEATEQLSDALWRVTAIGQTPPGREWLMEDFAIQSIRKRDGDAAGKPSIAYGPIVRHADAAAENRFTKSVRVRRKPKPAAKS